MKKLACCTIEMPGTKKSWHSHCNIELMTKKNVSKRAQLDVYVPYWLLQPAFAIYKYQAKFFSDEALNI